MSTRDVPEDAKAIIDSLMMHRSVRTFTSQPIESEVIDRLVAAGTRASSSGNLQAYSVVKITDRGLRTSLTKLCGNQPQVCEAPAFLVFCADLHKVSLACRANGMDDRAVGEAESLLLAIVDAALVMQNVAIAAESLGLGICMIGAVRNSPRAIADALCLPKHVIAIAGLCIGWPVDGGSPKPRLPLEATLHENRYRCDDELWDLIARYDDVLSTWYTEQGKDQLLPRWSRAVSQHLQAASARAEVGHFLRDQGFLTA